jgi:hypothetical protein
MLKDIVTRRAALVTLAAAALVAAAIAARPADPPGLAVPRGVAEVPLAQAYGP